jgi:hypothetical protein
MGKKQFLFLQHLYWCSPLEDKELTDTLKLEGKVTQIQYKVDDRSTLEVFRNYESALKQAGFEILFEEHGNSFSDARPARQGGASTCVLL